MTTELQWLCAVHIEFALDAAEGETCYRCVDPTVWVVGYPGLPTSCLCLSPQRTIPLVFSTERTFPLLRWTRRQGLRNRRHWPQGPTNIESRSQSLAATLVRTADNARDRTRRSNASITGKWLSAATITSAPSASPPTSPNGRGA
jgi:hypothetical protein